MKISGKGVVLILLFRIGIPFLIDPSLAVVLPEKDGG